MTDAHLETGEVSRYLAGQVSQRERERLEDHLASCEVCAAEVAAIVRLQRKPVHRHRWLKVAAAAAAAASVAGLLLLSQRSGMTPEHLDALRDTEAAPTVIVIQPAAGAAAGPDPLLVWHAVPSAVSYRVSITGENGDSLWAAVTRDTAMRIPAAPLAAAGQRRYWYVDALLPDGRSLSSGLLEFRIGS